MPSVLIKCAPLGLEAYIGTTASITSRVVEDDDVFFLLSMHSPRNEREKAQGVFFSPHHIEEIDMDVFKKFQESIQKANRGGRLNISDYKVTGPTCVSFMVGENEVLLRHVAGIPTFFRVCQESYVYTDADNMVKKIIELL